MPMDIQHLKPLLSQGETKQVIGHLLQLSATYNLPSGNEIVLLSSRFHIVTKEKNGGRISFDTYKLEINAINAAIYLVVDELHTLKFEQLAIKSFPKILETIQLFEKEYIQANQVSYLPARLRLKNNAAKSIGVLLQSNPGLLQQFSANPSTAVICGICKKIQMNPESGDLNTIEKFTLPSLGMFTKGNIVNAITELIYFQTLSIGDDHRVKVLLNNLKTNADQPLLKNIERAEAALQYLLIPDQTNKY